MSETTRAKIYLILSMLIFGTIGIFRKFLPLPSALLAFSRGIIGSVFIVLSFVFIKKKADFNGIKSKLPILCISGAFIGINWILLFEAYRFTTVATATLCYYMAPVFIIMASPVFLGERLTAKKVGCILCALFGMVLVSGALGADFKGTYELLGVILGILAALFYASVIIMNKKITGVPARERTMVQLFFAGVIVLPYSLLAENLSDIEFTIASLFLLIFVGIVHTGVAYLIYFGSLENIKGQTAAIFSYIDPVTAIILSAVVLREKIGITEIIGAVLVLGSTLLSELSENKEKQ